MRALVLLLLLVGCGPSCTDWSPATAQVKQVTVYGGTAEIISAVELYVERFEAVRGHLPPLRLYVVSTPIDRDALLFSGYTVERSPGDFVVFCWRGPSDELPSLYHEFEHVMVGDPDHCRPDWKAVNDEGWWVAESIRRQR